MHRRQRLGSSLVLVLALTAALLARAPEAGASGGDPPAGPAASGGERVVTATATVAAGPDYRLYAPATESICGAHNVCIWTDNYYRGLGLVMFGNFAQCQGFRFESTVFQNRTFSIWNRATGPFSIWDRYSDGSYRYHKYGWLPSGYRHDTEFSKIMDAIVYDPYNNCTSLQLIQVVDD